MKLAIKDHLIKSILNQWNNIILTLFVLLNSNWIQMPSVYTAQEVLNLNLLGERYHPIFVQTRSHCWVKLTFLFAIIITVKTYFLTKHCGLLFNPLPHCLFNARKCQQFHQTFSILQKFSTHWYKGRVQVFKLTISITKLKGVNEKQPLLYNALL